MAIYKIIGGTEEMDTLFKTDNRTRGHKWKPDTNCGEMVTSDLM